MATGRSPNAREAWADVLLLVGGANVGLGVFLAASDYVSFAITVVGLALFSLFLSYVLVPYQLRFERWKYRGVPASDRQHEIVLPSNSTPHPDAKLPPI
jgi:membrane protein YdbS with pleckstrin-like domain